MTQPAPPLTLDALLLARAQNKKIDEASAWAYTGTALVRGLMEGEYALCPDGHAVQGSEIKLSRSLKQRALVSTVGQMLANGTEDERLRAMVLWVGVLEYVQGHHETRQLLRRQAWTETLLSMTRCVERFMPGQGQSHMAQIQQTLAYPPGQKQGDMDWDLALAALRSIVLRIRLDRQSPAPAQEARRAM